MLKLYIVNQTNKLEEEMSEKKVVVTNSIITNSNFYEFTSFSDGDITIESETHRTQVFHADEAKELLEFLKKVIDQ